MFPLSTGNGRKRVSLCPLPVIRSKGDLKRSGQIGCTNTSKPLSLIQTFELAWKDIMLLLDQTLSSLEKQWTLARPFRREMIIIYN
jgi:hypothetical protein